MGKTLQGLISDQWAHHCKHHGTQATRQILSLWSQSSPAALSVTVWLVLLGAPPCQLSVPSVLHKMAAAQQPNTALLPGTRLPSLPQVPSTGSHCWRVSFITTTLTSAGLFVISHFYPDFDCTTTSHWFSLLQFCCSWILLSTLISLWHVTASVPFLLLIFQIPTIFDKRR